MTETAVPLWINLSWVGGSLLAAGVIAVVSAVISGKIVAAVLKVQLGDHARRLPLIEDWRVEADREIDDRRAERLACEARSALEYAQRGELSRLVADNTEQFRALMERLDALGEGLHARITESAKRIAAIEGRHQREDEG